MTMMKLAIATILLAAIPVAVGIWVLASLLPLTGIAGWVATMVGFGVIGTLGASSRARDTAEPFRA